MNDRLLSLLGLCRRAGRTAIGCDPVKDSVLNGKARLVVFARDVSQRTRRDILSVANECGVRTVTLDYSKEELGASLGKLCAVLSICDEGFAKKIIELSGKDNGEELILC